MARVVKGIAKRLFSKLCQSTASPGNATGSPLTLSRCACGYATARNLNDRWRTLARVSAKTPSENRLSLSIVFHSYSVGVSSLANAASNRVRFLSVKSSTLIQSKVSAAESSSN